jgi:hypothetical protein
MLGIPIKSVTDCGSETTLQFGFAHALQYALIPQCHIHHNHKSFLFYRERFYPEYDQAHLVPHQFLRSMENTIIEKGWRRFKLGWGDNIVRFFDSGVTRGIYDLNSPGHQYVHSPSIHCAQLTNPPVCFLSGFGLRFSNESL